MKKCTSRMNRGSAESSVIVDKNKGKDGVQTSDAGLKTEALRRSEEAELKVAERNMLRFYLGVTTFRMIRNEDINGTAHFRCSGRGKRDQTKMLWTYVTVICW